MRNGPYYQISLGKNGKTKIKLVHRLIAKAFIPNPENKPCINHKNGIKKDNGIENLEWCTQSENHKHAWTTGLKNQDGEKNPAAKFSNKQVRVLKWWKIINPKIKARQAKIFFHGSEGNINDIWAERRWGHIILCIFNKALWGKQQYKNH